MLPFKHPLLIKLTIILLIIITLMGLVIGLINHTPLVTLGWVILVLWGTVIIASLIGWLIGWSVGEIYRRSHSEKKIEQINEKPLKIIDGIKLEYELNPEDIIAYRIYNRESSPKLGRVMKILRRGTLVSLFLEIIVVVLLFIYGGEKLITVTSIVCFVALVTLVWFMFSPSFFRKSVKTEVIQHYTKGTNSLIGKHHFLIALDGVTDISDIGESKVRWNAIEWIASTDQYLFMNVHGSAPYVVPRRAFTDDEAFNGFIETVKSFHEGGVKRYQSS